MTQENKDDFLLRVHTLSMSDNPIAALSGRYLKAQHEYIEQFVRSEILRGTGFTHMGLLSTLSSETMKAIIVEEFLKTDPVRFASEVSAIDNYPGEELKTLVEDAIADVRKLK